MRALSSKTVTSNTISTSKSGKASQKVAPDAPSGREIRKRVEEHFASRPSKQIQKKEAEAKIKEERISTEMPDSEEELSIRKGKLQKLTKLEAPTSEKDGEKEPDMKMTSEKLKDVLASGAVNFSDRERNVLNEIIHK